MLIDTHAHLNDEAFDDDRQEVIARAREAGLLKIVCVGYDLPSSAAVVDLVQDEDFLAAVVGVHPHDAKQMQSEKDWEFLKELAQKPKVVAIGETGLDYYRDLSPRPVQQRVFRRHLQTAEKLGLPVVVHERDAAADTLRILQEVKISTGGVIHCFSGSIEMAREFIKLGFYLSLAGPVTFKNARRLQQTAKKLPLNRLLVETDCPYLAPEPRRGRRNEPAYVRYTAEFLAQTHGISVEELAQITTRNAKNLFKI